MKPNRLAVEPGTPALQDVGTLLPQWCADFFIRPAMAEKSGAQGAAADPHRSFADQTFHHLVQCDILAPFDHPDDEGLMRIQARDAAAASPTRLQLADPSAHNPADRTRYVHFEPRRRSPGRHAFARSLQDPQRASWSFTFPVRTASSMSVSIFEMPRSKAVASVSMRI